MTESLCQVCKKFTFYSAVMLTSIATPKHIDYETPKPHFNDQDPVGSLEDGDEFITASRQISPLETPNEYPGPDDDNSAANVAGQSSEILSSTLELELGTGKRKWKKIQQLLQDHIEELEPALKPLKEDLRIARELLDRGQRSRAETEYFKAVQKYINQKWKQDDPLIIAFVTELVEHFNSCTEDEMSTSVSLCLGLLQNFLLAFSPDSKNHSLVWAALDSLLWTHPGVVQEINMQRVIAALHDPDADERLCSALRSSLGRMPPSGNINEKGFRLSLLAFACHLKEYLEGSSLLGSRAAFSDLHKTLIYLWHSQRSFRSDDFMEGALVNDIHSIFVSELVQGNLALDKCYSSIEPSINRLAFASSVLGWFGEAEALFTVLRSTPSLKLITSDRGTEISVQYCLHLEIQKRYAELLLVLYDAYADFENSYKTTEYLQDYLFGVRRHILDMRDILNKVPGPLAQYVSSEKALEIVRLGHLTRKVFPISPISADREAEDDEDVEDVEDVEELIMEMDQNKVEDDGEQMDDCRSSNKFGVTYTESIITGISFNYSDLYWRWG